VGYANVPTSLLDAHAMAEVVSIDILSRAIFKPRRPRGGKIALFRLYEATEVGICFRWDEIFLKAASEIGHTALQRMREAIPVLQPLEIALTQSGDTLLIDNWRMLHARSPIPQGCENRRIQRVYLESLH
jgi:hypothetical protein